MFGTFFLNISRSSLISLLKVIFSGKLELIKFKSWIEDPFSAIYGNFSSNSLLKLVISFAVLLEFGIIKISWDNNSFIKFLIEPN